MTEILGGIEDFGTPRSDINQVNEEAVTRAQEENKKAKKVAQDIKKDKAINEHFAQFLSMLLKSITDEGLISAIYESFFKTTNPENNITYLRKDINTKVIIGFFIPFFLEEAKKTKILSFYEPLSPQTANTSLQAYIRYLETLSHSYHDNIPINQSAFVELVIRIITHFMPKENKADLKNEILVQLYERR